MADKAPPQRTLIAGYLHDPTGRAVRLTDIVVTATAPVAASDIQALLLAKAARLGLDLRPGAGPGLGIALPLQPIPRPTAGDSRLLLAWAITAYIVAHDVKFGGYGKGVFAWPEEPSGQALDAMVHVLATDTLARMIFQPAEGMRFDIISVTVTPSSEPPSDYR